MEVRTHCATILDSLASLVANPAQTKLYESVARGAHSVRGAARIVGVQPVGDFATALEDLFNHGREGKYKLTSNDADWLKRAVVEVQSILDSAEDDSAKWAADHAPALNQARESVLRLLRGETVTAPAAPTAAAAPEPRKEPETPPTSTVHESANAEGIVLAPTGNIRSATANELREALLRVSKQNVGSVTLDLSKVRDIDPAGLAVLAMFAPASMKKYVAHADVRLRLLLESTGLDAAYSAEGTA